MASYEAWNSAIASYRKGLKTAKEMTYAEGQLGMAYGLSGHKEKAKEVLRYLEELSQGRFVSPLDIAWVYFGLNNLDKTFEYLEKAAEIRASHLVFFKVMPQIEYIRSDPRGQAFLRRIGLDK